MDYARMRWGLYLLVLRREYGNIFYRGARGIIFPYSLLRTGKSMESSCANTGSDF